MRTVYLKNARLKTKILLQKNMVKIASVPDDNLLSNSGNENTVDEDEIKNYNNSVIIESVDKDETGRRAEYKKVKKRNS